MKIALVILGAVAAVVFGFFIHSHFAEKAVWQKLSESVPGKALTPTEIQNTNDAVSCRLTPESDEVGHVLLANGDIWRFAFRSHHCIGGPDSYSVFSGPLGTFRVRGTVFCCEVQFPDTAPMRDSNEFLAFLRRTNVSVEPAK